MVRVRVEVVAGDTDSHVAQHGVEWVGLRIPWLHVCHATRRAAPGIHGALFGATVSGIDRPLIMK